jgi:hypothetical protein
LSLWINAIGVPVGIWAVVEYFTHANVLPIWMVWFSLLNITLFVVALTLLYINTWRRTKLVLNRWIDRVWYMLRVNPVFAMIWWFLWIIPLAIGYRMYLLDEGLAWQRTEKIDANKMLIRSKYRDSVLTRRSQPEESRLE